MAPDEPDPVTARRIAFAQNEYLVVRYRPKFQQKQNVTSHSTPDTAKLDAESRGAAKPPKVKSTAVATQEQKTHWSPRLAQRTSNLRQICRPGKSLMH